MARRKPQRQQQKAAPSITADQRAANIRLMLGRAQDQSTKQRFQAPALMPGVVPAGETAAIAMDSCAATYEYASASLPMDFKPFPGYPYLANLSTRTEYRAFASVMSSELFREWITFSGANTGTPDAIQDEERIGQLEDAIRRHNLQGVFRLAAEHDCLFGRAQVLPKIKNADLSLPMVLSPKTIKQGSLEGFANIEAIWTTPSAYNAIDPTAPDFYKPREWWMLGERIHASRILTIISRQLPDILKPAYNFGGMSLSQLAEPYVNNWLRTRQAVSDLINNFSITGLKTNMAQTLQGNCDGADVFARADLFTLTRSNRGLMLLDFENEELVQHNVPMTGLHELQAQSQEHMCLAEGTVVQTRRGGINIENIVAGDEVMTRDGYAPVEWSGQTGEATSMIGIECGDSAILATGDHPVWIESKKDFVPAKNVQPFQRLRKSPAWEFMEYPSHGEGVCGALRKAGITAIQKPEGFSIASFTKRMLGKFRSAWTFITKTDAVCTTHSTTSNYSHDQSTRSNMSQRDGERNYQTDTKSHANNAVVHLKRAGLIERSFAQALAKLQIGDQETLTTCVSQVSLENPIKVYNLKVKDGYLPEFYANGILVHNCSATRIPAMILTGISPTGMNASSEGEMRSFYDWISSQQEAHWRFPLDTCIKLIMLDLWGEIDETITWDFDPLWQPSDKELAEIRTANANADGVYIDRGVLSQEESRKRLANDKSSGYAGIDVSDVPEQPESEGNPFFGGEEDPEQAQDKSVSPEQHRAMEAAAHGKSALGIPKSVGEEFVKKDAA